VITQESDAVRDEAIITELETLRAEEDRLRRAYANLSRRPALMARFWMDLVALRNRADSLEAVLNTTPPRPCRHAARPYRAAIGTLCA
jgi:hypothetical protein